MQFFKYIISGVVNTSVGYAVFFILLRIFKVSPEYANAVGYCIALVFAFTLNKVFVFNKSISNRKLIPKFLAAYILSFSANQLVLMVLYRNVGISAEIAQIFSMTSYTLFFYFLNKHLVFSERVRGC